MIVHFSLPLIAQSLISLVYGSKLFFGAGVLINVGVVFLGKLEIRLLDLVLVVLQLWARPEIFDQDLDSVLSLLVVIIALINLDFLGFNGENGDLVTLLDREASFVCLGKEKDEVGTLGERLRH